MIKREEAERIARGIASVDVLLLVRESSAYFTFSFGNRITLTGSSVGGVEHVYVNKESGKAGRYHWLDTDAGVYEAGSVIIYKENKYESRND